MCFTAGHMLYRRTSSLRKKKKKKRFQGHSVWILHLDRHGWMWNLKYVWAVWSHSIDFFFLASVNIKLLLYFRPALFKKKKSSWYSDLDERLSLWGAMMDRQSQRSANKRKLLKYYVTQRKIRTYLHISPPIVQYVIKAFEELRIFTA